MVPSAPLIRSLSHPFLSFLSVYFQGEDHELSVSGLGGRRVGGELAHPK